MKKICSIIILLSLFILIFSGCNNIENQQATANSTQQINQAVKDTPHQIGQKGQMFSSVEGFYFDKSYDEADIVAQVKILEWLGERNNEDEFEKTIFRASLEKIYKNTVDINLKEIKLFQTGNSYYTIKDCPLFKNGDVLLLYLKKAVNEDNTYWILGGYTGVFRIVNTDGQDYVVKQVGDCPELSDALAKEDSDKIRKKLKKDYKIEFSDIDKRLPETYKLDKVEKLIKTRKDKGR